MDSRYGQTDFRQFAHAQLVAMLAAGRPADVGVAAGGWRDLANTLDNVATLIEQRDRQLRPLWQGAASEAHAEMIASLVDGVRQVAFVARGAGDQVDAAAEALRQAQAQMAALGPPLIVTPPDQATIAAASAALPYGRPELPAAAAAQATAVRALQDFQRAQAAAGARTAAAVAILSDLRDLYSNVDFPSLPQVAEPPTLAPDGTPIFSTEATTGAAGATGTSGTSGVSAAARPLFADLWGDGLAAAAGLPPAQLIGPYQATSPGATGDPSAGSPSAGGPFGGGLAAGGGAVGALAAGLGRAGVGAAAGPGGSAAAPLGGPGALPGGGALPGAGAGVGSSLDAGVPSAVGQSSLASKVDLTPPGAAGGSTVPSFLGGGFGGAGGGGALAGGVGSGSVAAWLIGEVEEFGVRATVVPGVVD